MNINKRLFITTLIIISFVIIFTSVLMPPSRANAKNTQSREEIIINELLARDSEIIKKEPAAFVEKLNKIGASVFSFYRGTAALFYRDMFEPAMNLSSGDKGFTMPEFEKCHINGDLHIANFGFSIDSEGRIQFDANDFDESYISSYSLDLKRLLISILLMAKEEGIKDGQNLADAFLNGFIEKIKDFKNGENAGEYIVTAQNSKGYVSNTIESLKGKDRPNFLKKFTQMKRGNRFLENDELRRLPAETAAKIKDLFTAQYAAGVIKKSSRKYEDGFFKILDVCEKLRSGTGSLGLKRYYILIGGDSPEGYEKNLIIEMKQQRDSVVSAYAPKQGDPAFTTNAGRVLAGTYLMCSNVSAFIGTIEDGKDSYLLREISPQKYSPRFNKMGPSGLENLCETSGKIYAKMLIKCINQNSSLKAAKFLLKIKNNGGTDSFKQHFKDIAVKYALIVENDFNLYSKNKAALIKRFEAGAAR